MVYASSGWKTQWVTTQPRLPWLQWLSPRRSEGAIKSISRSQPWLTLQSHWAPQWALSTEMWGQWLLGHSVACLQYRRLPDPGPPPRRSAPRWPQLQAPPPGGPVQVVCTSVSNRNPVWWRPRAQSRTDPSLNVKLPLATNAQFSFWNPVFLSK